MKVTRVKFYVILALALAISLVCPRAIAGQTDLATKPYKLWTRSEATKILNNSPWAITQEARVDFGKELRKIAGAPVVDGTYLAAELGGANIAVDFRVTLRLRSAMPIRQAIVRLKQIEANYDRMSDKVRAGFDAKTQGLLNCPGCAQNYVITISCKSLNYPGADALYEGLRGATLPAIRPYIYILNERGEKRELIHFVAPKAPNEEAIFFFPRVDDEDKPLLTPTTRKLLFRMSDNNARAITNFEIDVSTLILAGKVEF